MILQDVFNQLKSLGFWVGLQPAHFVIFKHPVAISTTCRVQQLMWHCYSTIRYKGQYRPSFLVCPETYSWQPIEYCRPILDLSKYSRLDPDVAAVDNNKLATLDNVKVLFMREVRQQVSFVTVLLVNMEACEFKVSVR